LGNIPYGLPYVRFYDIIILLQNQIPSRNVLSGKGSVNVCFADAKLCDYPMEVYYERK
jgi:hypothetical protein